MVNRLNPHIKLAVRIAVLYRTRVFSGTSATPMTKALDSDGHKNLRRRSYVLGRSLPTYRLLSTSLSINLIDKFVREYRSYKLTRTPDNVVGQ